MNHLLLRIVLAVFCTAALFPNVATAQIPDFPLNIKAQLEAETPNPEPGKTLTLAIVMTPNEGWHGYWENPGDAGVGIQLNWTLPDGVTASKPRFPVPEKLIISDLMNFTYEGEHSFLVDINIDDNIPAGNIVPITVEADWLACTDRICVPEHDILSIDLITGDGVISQKSKERFGAFRSKLAIPLDQKAHYQIQGDTIALAIPVPENAQIIDPYFFPLRDQIIDYLAPQAFARNGDMAIMKMKISPYAPKNFNEELGGIVRIAPHYGIEIAADPSIIEGAFDSTLIETNFNGQEFGSIWLLLFSAILGGLILNLMPCVFPIIGLKALSLAKMGDDSAKAKREALAYSGGVIISTVALGALLLILRAGGEQIGWAFQLQSPVIIFALLILMILITLNLMGLFELTAISFGQKLTQGTGTIGSFWTGVLAAFIATPCTGPFMALALGAALILPTVQALLLFFGLGFGLALPYLLIAYIPFIRRKLPKPGSWMEIFRKVMSIPMAVTAIALLWLLSRVGGHTAFTIAMVSTALTIIILVYIRKYQKNALNIPKIFIISSLLLWISSGIIIANLNDESVQSSTKKWVQVENYDPDKLDDYKRDGKSIFLYFTADWCVTCKANEFGAIQREKTANLFKAKNIIVMEGDFTKQNPEIANILHQYGRSGVPLYLFFKGNTEAQILPQILTVEILNESIKGQK